MAGKKRNHIFLYSLILMLSMVFSVSPAVLAGVSNIVIDKGSFTGEIEPSIWNNVNSDIKSVNNVLIFDSECASDSRLVSKANVLKQAGYSDLIRAQVIMNIVSIPQGKKFVFALGLDGIEALIGDPGNIQVEFTNIGSALSVGVTMIAEDLSVQQLAVPSANFGGIGFSKSLSLEIQISTLGKMVVKINGKTLCSEVEVGNNGEGRAGFLQSAVCNVRITDLKMLSYLYDTPENSNIKEDFHEGDFNVGVLTSKLIFGGKFPCGIAVEEYKGDNVMMFRNTGLSYISTKHQYSNFEISFDVPYLLRENLRDEEGNTISEKSQWFGVSFGDDSINHDSYGFQNSPEFVYFNESSSAISFSTEKVFSNAKYPFFDAEEGKPFSIKMSMIDSQLTVSIKWVDETAYTTLISYSMAGITPVGYIHIWALGPGNFAIDNLNIVNRDNNPNLIEIPFTANKISVPNDYQYTALSRYMGANVISTPKFSWYYLILIGGLAGLILIGGTAAVAYIIKRHTFTAKEDTGEK